MVLFGSCLKPYTGLAPKIWYETLTKFLVTLGFQRSMRDVCLFKNLQSGVILVVYVDDLAIGGPSQSANSGLVTQLQARFKMPELGSPKVFLGINIKHFPERLILFISQESYIRSLLEKYELTTAVSKTTPMAPTSSLAPIQMDSELTSQPFRSLVGELLYISICTRPDIAFAVSPQQIL